MKYAKLFLFIFAGLLMLSSAAFGQDGPPPTAEGRPDDRRQNLFAELGLAPEQLQQIRRFNQERRPQMQEARRRMGEAQRNLDMAIYGDAVITDAEFQTRLKEFQAAEQEVSRLRFEGELAIRKVLTPEQLVRFREIRRRFAEEMRKNGQQRRMLRRGDQFMPGQPPPDKQPAPQTRPVRRTINE
ncbi:MAG TPA: Spy/CpxP family protein refolding chaperone [Pyrinomonadaceae bacterium]|nr:Spy/CpxP family protein refolding chaperone [Pyrinomonadaceae bacterium]